MTQAELRAKKQPVAKADVPLCLHRSTRSIGKLRCSCANAPLVYTCDEPWVRSGYCLPVLPHQPGDGPIVTTAGETIVPVDTRRTTFLPMPMLPDETPRHWDLVTCESCPHRSEPPPHIAALMRLGIDGDYDPHTGHAEILHLVPRGARPTVDVPTGKSSVWAEVSSLSDASEYLTATNCRLLIIYSHAATAATIRCTRESHPAIPIWWVDPDRNRPLDRQPQVHYGLPPDLASQLLQATRRAYAEALSRLLP